MKGTLVKNRHVLLLERGLVSEEEEGKGANSIHFINKMERFTERLSWGHSPEVGENPTP